MRVLRLGERPTSGSTLEPEAPPSGRCRHLRDVQDRPRGRGRGRRPSERAILSLIGPARGRARRLAPSAPEHAQRSRRAGRHRGARASRTDAGIDLIVARRRARRACATRCSPPAPSRSATEAAEIVRIESGRPALRRRDGRRDDAGRGRASSSAPSASPRAATSARSRSPASTTGAGRTGTCAGCASSAPAAPGDRCCWARGGRARSAAPASPPPAGRSRSRSSVARRTGGEQSRSARRRDRRGRRAPLHCLTNAAACPSVRLDSSTNAAEEGQSVALAAALLAVLAWRDAAGATSKRSRSTVPAVVSVKIATDGVGVSPKEFGAGQVNFTVANLTNQTGSLASTAR